MDTTTLDSLRAMRARYEAEGDPDMAHAADLALCREGRRLALASEGALGWCSHHRELHPTLMFRPDSRRRGGIGSYCLTAYSERARGARTAKAEAPPEPPVEEVVEPLVKPKTCRKCKGKWTPAAGDKKERCPACRGRASK